MSKQRTSFAIFWRLLMEGLCFFPIFLLIGIFMFSDTSIYYWLIGIAVVFLLSYLLASLSRYPAWTLILTAGVILLTGWLITTSIWIIVPVILILSVVGYRGIQYAYADWGQLLPSMVMWAVSLPSYFIGYLFFYFLEKLQPYLSWLSTAGLIFIVMLLFVTNQNHLQKESLSKGKQKLSKGMTTLNRGYLLLTLAIVLVITNFQVVQSSLYHMVRGIIQFFIWLGSLFSSESGPAEEPPVQAPSMFPDEPAQEKSAFAEWTELLMQIFVIILLIAGVAFVIALLFKKFRRLLKRIGAALWRAIKQVFIRNGHQQTTMDYEDTKENLFDWRKWRKEQKDKWVRTFTRKTSHQPKTAEERVRRLYLYVANEVKQEEKWHHALTAHEVLERSENQLTKQQLQEWYDDIRYGGKTFTSDEKQQIDQLWQKWQQK
ncbi:hypothetical protein [Gracilibacillus alcaliphilus]|uniref:hypothetical protein n=1 Tax=Gracilibacillus alcaliphilus TaxID=1401441 RepID=UPI00195E0871|nr:hypothetical protein [Gracilibacillus alcaliphilus]MBM7676002.1 heme/copper-type cytochrome/quinol oxidase subunit 2 [Gracilibacillus alcaliphilus]